jgi:tetratricopeptide (TPR) repeat protein
MLKRLLHIIFVLLLLCACGNREAQWMLDRAEAVMSDNPSEAIAVLDSIGDDGLSRSQHMRRLLLLTNAQNKCDTVFRSDSIQRLLVDYYESHGTANERMLAHYLLGRAYYDMGEMPMALNAYQLALADTSGTEKDYYLLTRIHAQISNIFFKQNLIDDQLKHIDLSVKYALLSHDTIGAILNNAQKTYAYERKGEIDSALYYCQQSSMLAKKHGYQKLSAGILGGAITILVEKDSLNKAKTFMDIYEPESGFFDKNHGIAKGREIYYYTKGRYYLGKEKYDSAEFFFRKELREGKDFNNQNAASRGLALLFQKTHQPDSAAKYALYSYAMNDSVYAHMATDEVERMKAMYDYNRHLKLAEAKSREAQATRSLVWILSLFCLSIILSLYIVILRHKKREEEMVRREENLYKRLVELEDSQKEKERFKRTIEQEQRILNSTIAKHFRDLAQKPANLPSSTDWKSMLDMISRELPSFQALLCDNQLNLRQEEMNICMLIRLRFKPKEICNLTGLSSQNVTNIRKRLLYKIYGDESGGSKDFDQRIMKIQ